MVPLQGTLRVLLSGETVWPTTWSTEGEDSHRKMAKWCSFMCAWQQTQLVSLMPFLGQWMWPRRGFRIPTRSLQMLDSGSQCTTITRTISDTQFLNNGLHQLPLSLHNFDGSAVLAVHGYFRMTAQFMDRSCPVNVYVLNDSCAPVIGRDLLTHLNMNVDFGTMQV